MCYFFFPQSEKFAIYFVGGEEFVKIRVQELLMLGVKEMLPLKKMRPKKPDIRGKLKVPKEK